MYMYDDRCTVLTTVNCSPSRYRVRYSISTKIEIFIANKNTGARNDKAYTIIDIDATVRAVSCMVSGLHDVSRDTR